MNEQIKLAKELIVNIKNKDKLMQLYLSVDSDELREAIYKHWCSSIGNSDSFDNFLGRYNEM